MTFLAWILTQRYTGHIHPHLGACTFKQESAPKVKANICVEKQKRKEKIFLRLECKKSYLFLSPEPFNKSVVAPSHEIFTNAKRVKSI